MIFFLDFMLRVVNLPRYLDTRFEFIKEVQLDLNLRYIFLLYTTAPQVNVSTFTFIISSESRKEYARLPKLPINARTILLSSGAHINKLNPSRIARATTRPAACLPTPSTRLPAAPPHAFLIQ